MYIDHGTYIYNELLIKFPFKISFYEWAWMFIPGYFGYPDLFFIWLAQLPKEQICGR